MNCKPGDLAVIVSSPNSPENIGKIVRCVRVISEKEPVDGMRWVASSVGHIVWLVEANGSPLAWRAYGDNYFVQRRAYADKCLRPLRDNHGEDETMTWAGKPEGVMA